MSDVILLPDLVGLLDTSWITGNVQPRYCSKGPASGVGGGGVGRES